MIVYIWKLLKMFLKIWNFYVEYLIIDETIYWEQMYTILLNHVDYHFLQYSVISKWVKFSPFLSLVIFFLAISNNITISSANVLDNILS